MTNFESFRKGMIMGLPLAVGVGTYGVVYGILTQNVLTTPETILSCLIVYAGVSQILALDLWQHPLPVYMIILSTFIINLRHMLMSASVYPYALNENRWLSYFTMFFMVDEGWALSMGEFRKGTARIGFLLGTGVINYIFWVTAAMAGRTMGALIPSPEAIGIDFTLTAVFLTIGAGSFRGRKDIPIILTAFIFAVITYQFVGGKWYILAGGIAGGLAGWLSYDRS
ncbi:AzlC family protein [Denitrovibrio acetiphilus DSM 12809]|uniref:AzlC family protein n=1 Tax=Denitrovibrio acetiphilus (strain DSM 12809 / NBRC 114555 / N2460) TaxID=522772 RepID=D4H6T1_DENA2|nr:AzlC family ABC transporter permease [Denitrovibrio acetiphilus]ADD67797.1 AzlC family protein [Denitrovibrio acetiphilus DSM 12809]